MDEKDSFQTVEYKGFGYIHTCHNRTTGKLEVKSQIGYETRQHKTVDGAKRYITSVLKRTGGNIRHAGTP
jgi:hypothetical protein